MWTTHYIVLSINFWDKFTPVKINIEPIISENIIFSFSNNHPKKYDVIIFSRFLKNSKRFYDDNKNIKNSITNFSNYLNKLGKIFLYKDITDYTSGFICVNKKFL